MNQMRNDAAEAVRSYYRTILPFYEDESKERDDLVFWRNLMAERKPRSILDLGAGTGRVTAVLREFAAVVALDLSPEMLERAEARLHGKHKFPVELVVGDMRNFDFARRFDLVVASNDPFAHLTRRREREMALRAIAKHIAPGGSVVIEGLYHPERRRFEKAGQSANGVSVREVWTPRGHDCWQARYYYRRGEQGEELEAEFVARAWNAAEAEELLARCGLRLKEMWGDFERRGFTRDAERVILVGRGGIE